MLAVAIVAGVAIGISLGALGGGGSILTVPVLVYALNESPKTATTASLIIVGITGLTGAVGHARAGRVRWRAGLIFGLLGTVASVGATKLNHSVDPQALLLAFAGLMVVASVAMFRRSCGSAAESDENARGPSPFHRPPVRPGSRNQTWEGSTLVVDASAVATDSRARTGGSIGAPKVVIAALMVGFLTGFFGVGGGFVIVPALVVALRYEMPVAVGTSLVIIAINSAGALVVRVGHSSIPWHVVLPFTAAAIIGSFAGKRVADRVSGNSLTRAFAVLLIAVASYVAIRAGLQL